MVLKTARRTPDAAYFRKQAERARRLAGDIGNKTVAVELCRMAQEYDAMADDLEGKPTC